MLFSQFVFGVVLAFGAGIFFASFFSSSYFFILPLLVVGIILASVFWRKWSVVHMGVLIAVSAFSMAYYLTAAKLPEPLSFPQDVSFEGRIVTSPERDEQAMKVIVKPAHMKGRVLLYVSSFEELRQGDRVLVSGKILTPTVFEDFNYPLYLAKEGIFWVMFRPSIEVQQKGTSFLFNLRETLQERIDTSLPLPESSLLASMLLGNKAGLPEELKEDLNATGTRHITAISGMHVAILSGMLFVFLLHLGIPRKKSSLVVLGFLLFFVMFTGSQASALRAGIMGSAFLIAGLFGRRNVGLRVLVFAAAFMLFFNPLLLAHDISFQLSFLAVFGILLFLPLFKYVFGRLPNPLGLRDVVFMSITAQIFTLPLVLYHFGILSFVSLAGNLLIVPLIPLVLFLGVLFLLLSMLLPFLAYLFAFPVGLLLSYLSFVITALSEFPFAAGSVEGFPLWVLLPLLLPASFFAWRVQQEKRFRFREETMI
ncbi:ComEC family competence protein [Patescibacteria group bacterium]|nr:ComEC family competence protein [Patescibacteria group bacterium]